MIQNEEAYATFKNARKIPNAIIEHMFVNTPNIWKMLKYDKNPLNEKELTTKEKRNMIALTSMEAENKNIIMQRFNSEANTKGIPQIRIQVINIRPYKGRTIGMCTILMQVCIPNQMEIISTDESPYDTRSMAITQELIESLNGVELSDGIGYLFLNGKIDGSTGATAISFNQEYSGYQLTMNMEIYG